MRPVLLGEAPSYRGSSLYPFDVGREPVPTGSGARLAEIIGVSHQRLGELFIVRNLLEHPVVGPFPISDGRAAAQEILETLRGRIVLCGRNVCRSFNVPGLPWCRWLRRGDVELASIPHPSGLNRFYNNHSNRLRVRRFLRRAMKGE